MGVSRAYRTPREGGSWAGSAMKGAGFLIVVVAFAAHAAGPKESFDIARFVRPRGWQRTQSPGLLTFQVSAARNAQLSSGQIFVFASELSSGAPTENFETAWGKLVVAPIGGIGGQQQLQTEQTPVAGPRSPARRITAAKEGCSATC